MTSHGPLTIADIPWLRMAARQAGVLEVPRAIAAKLVAGGFVERNVTSNCLTITTRGKLALSRLA